VLGSGSQAWSPTRFRVPLIDAGWIEDGTHVTTIGPKTATAHEVPPELADRATVIAGDSRGQAHTYGEPFFIAPPGRPSRRDPRRRGAGRIGPDGITLYCTTGLAGSETALASALLTGLERFAT
jgi:ornithine cyclodeaminase/alanine dehydrogenase-like protein (mu-crystallin family)